VVTCRIEFLAARYRAPVAPLARRRAVRACVHVDFIKRPGIPGDPLPREKVTIAPALGIIAPISC